MTNENEAPLLITKDQHQHHLHHAAIDPSDEEDHDDYSSNYNPPVTKDELYQELDELLTAFCSDAQQQFCVDQGIILPDDLDRMRQTVEQIQTLLPTMDRNNNLQLRRALARAIHDILQHYADACQQRHMRLLDEVLTNQYIGDWHRLKQQWDLKNKENQHILLILEDIRILIHSWQQQQQQQQHHSHSNSGNKNLTLLPSISTLLPQRLSSSTSTKRNSLGISDNKRSPKAVTSSSSTASTVPPYTSSLVKLSSTAEETLTSILTTFEYPPGAYTVIIDKHNCGQLGLQHSKIGSRQIIFDSHQISSNDIIETVTQLCDTFASLFASTAHHHLAQIDSQIRKAQPFYTSTHMKRLSTRIFDMGGAASTIMEDGDYDLNEHNDGGGETAYHYRDPPYDPQLHDRLHSILDANRPSSSMAVLTPFRLTTNTPHMLRHLPIPIPSFVPAPWQIPDLLKPRYPYNSVFFGLIRRRTNYNSNNNSGRKTLSYHVQHPDPSRRTSTNRGYHSGHQHYRTTLTTEDKNDINKNAPNTSPPNCHAAIIDEGIDSNPSLHYPPVQPRASISTSPLQRRGSKLNRTKNLVTSAFHVGNSTTRMDGYNDDWDGPTNDSTRVAPFTSVSVEKLSVHLGKIAGQFYQDLLMHTRMRYQETQSTLESIEWQMMDLYRHLQLASSRAVMQRAMVIVHELDERHQTHLDGSHDYYQHYTYTQDQEGRTMSHSSDAQEGADQWKPICTDSIQATDGKGNHSGTTTTTTLSNGKDESDQDGPVSTSTTAMTTHSSTTIHNQGDPVQAALKNDTLEKPQPNNSASVTSSFNTAASGLV